MSENRRRQGFREDNRQRSEHPRARDVKPRHHDTYAAKAKMAKALVCDDCGVVFHGGRWYWGAPPLTEVRAGTCPACQRIRDRYPAGTIRLPEKFLEQREEIMGMIRNAEQNERAEHPLERVMSIEDEPSGGLVITTTGVHLARAITSKLERRFHRQARIRYPKEEMLMRVYWVA